MITSSSILLLTINVSLVLVSLYWTIIAWSDLNQARSERPWTKSQCVVVNTSVIPAHQSLDQSLFCPQMTVNVTVPNSANFTIGSSNTQNSHFFPFVNVTFLSKQSISLENNRFYRICVKQIVEEEDLLNCSTNKASLESNLIGYKTGNNLTCWASVFYPQQENSTTHTTGIGNPYLLGVSLLPVETGVRRSHINVAVFSTVISISAVLSLSAIIFLLCIPRAAYVMSAEQTAAHLTAAAVIGRPPARGLSRDAIDAIIQAAEESDSHVSTAVDTYDRTCPICLELGLGARLACNHAFHSQCIRAWLSRGGETCPLCCATIKPPLSPLTPVCLSDVESNSNSTSTTSRPSPVSVAAATVVTTAGASSSDGAQNDVGSLLGSAVADRSRSNEVNNIDNDDNSTTRNNNNNNADADDNDDVVEEVNVVGENDNGDEDIVELLELPEISPGSTNTNTTGTPSTLQQRGGSALSRASLQRLPLPRRTFPRLPRLLDLAQQQRQLEQSEIEEAEGSVRSLEQRPFNRVVEGYDRSVTNSSVGQDDMQSNLVETVDDSAMLLSGGEASEHLSNNGGNENGQQ